ncbi:transposase [Lysinibacillus agricola]|uniref:transposase n=1 Tax=Lysinibacillus agricola TaxID=2590012 RepID=UPI003C298B60
MSNKRYDDLIKKKVAQLYLQGKTVSDLAVEFDVSPTSIYTWVKSYKDQNDFSEKDYKKILKENTRLKQEVEILKKAMTIMNSKEV